MNAAPTEEIKRIAEEDSLDPRLTSEERTIVEDAAQMPHGPHPWSRLRMAAISAFRPEDQSWDSSDNPLDGDVEGEQ